MPVVLGPAPSPVPTELIAKLQQVSFPTIGHYLEEGFADSGLVQQAGSGRTVGRAVTVRTTSTDSTMLHHAAGYVEPGDVLIVDTGGDLRHAPVGLVLAEAAATRGATGIIVDGVVTDVDEINDVGIPVFARGRSVLTTKLHGIDAGGMNVPVVCGGVSVNAGDIVLADANGVFFASVAVLEQIIDTALADDAEEHELVAAIKAGARLGDETGATEMVNRLLAGATS